MMTNGDLVKGGQIDPPPLYVERYFYFERRKRQVRLEKSKFFYHQFPNPFVLEKYQYQLFSYISRNSLMISHENRGGQFDPPPLVRDGVKRPTSISPRQRKSMKKPISRVGPPESVAARQQHTRTNSQ